MFRFRKLGQRKKRSPSNRHYKKRFHAEWLTKGKSNEKKVSIYTITHNLEAKENPLNRIPISTSLIK